MASAATSSSSTAKGSTAGTEFVDPLSVAPKVTKDTATMELQKYLPRLPVPDLKHTMKWYLHSVQPLLTAQQFANTQKLAAAFMDGVGPELQRQLVERANAMSKTSWDSQHESCSWLEEWWNDLAYLSSRDSLLATNVFTTIHEGRPFHRPMERTAQAISSLLMVNRMITNGKLKPDALRDGTPLCAHQYNLIFGTTRLPAAPKDRVYVCKSEHIAVLWAGHVFCLNVFNDDGTHLSPADMFVQLQRIKADAKANKGLAVSPSWWTYLPREEWAAVREGLLADPTNASTLRAIERALFVVVLSDDTPQSASELSTALLASAGAWLDKTMTFVAFANGRMGIHFSHALVDGSTLTRMQLESRKYESKHPFDSTKDRPSKVVAPVRRHGWNLSSAQVESLRKAGQYASGLVKDVNMVAHTFKEFGMNVIKAHRLSPDAFFQMALQLAFCRDQGGSVPATYESAITRIYLRCRTETIRSCTPEGARFVAAMLDSSVSAGARVALLREAAKAHREQATRAGMGMGIDRHLLGLRVLAAGAGLDVPLFSDIGMTKSSDFKLSTSQIRYPFNDYCGFAAPTDGYGVTYNLYNEGIGFTIIEKVSDKTTSATRFSEVLQQAIRDLRSTLDEANPRSKL